VPDLPDGTARDEEAAGDEVATESVTDRTEPDPAWQATGLELARAVAGEIAGRGERSRRRRRPDIVGGEGPSRDRTERSGGFSGARPDERDPQGMDAVLRRLVDERGWQADLKLAAGVARWPAVVGAQLAEHTTADRFADGVLYVQADSTSWATQVRMLASVIVAKLAADLGDGVVTRIVVQGPSGPSWRHGGRRVKGRGPRDTYG
jgi:predicted nucleic acid-binding Zn ribbon protein